MCYQARATPKSDPLRICHRQLTSSWLKSCENGSYFSYDFSHSFRSQIRTWHGSWAAVTCAKLWSDLIIICHKNSPWISTMFGSWAYKCFVKSITAHPRDIYIVVATVWSCTCMFCILPEVLHHVVDYGNQLVLMNYYIIWPNETYLGWEILNSLWPSDAIWWCKSGSILIKVMACCLTGPSYYLNQFWVIINEACWHLKSYCSVEGY